MNDFQMYTEPPFWRLVSEIAMPASGCCRLYMVARVTEPKDPRMQHAYIQSDGRWTSDRDGLVSLAFEPQWFGPFPVSPPMPPAEWFDQKGEHLPDWYR